MEIYITDLAAYNHGHLIGEWVSLPIDEELLQAKVTEILSEGANVCGDNIHEEIFITDYESDLITVNEYDDIFRLNQIAEQSEHLNEYEIKAVKFLLETYLVKDFNEALERYEDVIIHEDSSMADIAYNYVNECYDLDSIPSLIANNIDYDRIAREMEMDGCYYEVEGDIFEYIG